MFDICAARGQKKFLILDRLEKKLKIKAGKVAPAARLVAEWRNSAASVNKTLAGSPNDLNTFRLGRSTQRMSN